MIRATLAGGLMILALVACAQQAEEMAGSDSTIAARFGDTVITVAEVEEAAGGQLIGLNQQIFQVKDQQLRRMIFDQLVDQAAAEEGIDRAEYLDREVNKAVAPPTEEQIQQIFDQYRSQLPPDEEQARQQIVGFLSQQARAQAENALRERLFAEAGVVIMLDPPRVKPVIEAYNPTRGPADAPVVLVEYTDYQCPYCDRAQPTIDAVLERYGDSVVHVFKNLPLPMHQQAVLAAEAALCAGDQGKFWDLHDWLFANKNNISRDTLIAQAEVLGLDMETFTTCVDSRTHQAVVEADMAEATRFGIRGTPGFAINGRVLSGAQPLENFIAIIDDELRRQGLPIPGTETAEDEGADESS
jgi:predicted DsbA family dithiol-disulfide isomerase